MKNTFLHICNRIIEYGFYTLFFLVPLVITSQTSELFEFNKMWITFGVTTIIITAWIVKMVVQQQFFIQRTPLDIPLLCFLFAHIVATIYTLDRHISLWGYYSRFNGGFLSILSYILLYYAFVSNLGKIHAYRLIIVSLISAACVALWGLPSHFGYDPTCYVFRDALDVSCWTESFQPKIRIFSTLGQPNWLAVYLGIVLPLSIAFGIDTMRKKSSRVLTILSFCLSTILFLDLLYSGSRSGFVGVVAGISFATFLFLLIAKINNKLNVKVMQILTLLFLLFLAISLWQGTPVTKPFNEYFNNTQSIKQHVQGPALETGGTESGTIRLIVWQGAIDAWKHFPIFGSGVETFAFAYYKYRPVAHNLTSEWDFLYNKAHNEYLNYLTTTGIVGLVSYLSIIGVFFFITLYVLLQKRKANETISFRDSIYTIALIASYTTILVSNFFGFSVVIVNLYFFLIPALVFLLLEKLSPKHIILWPHLVKEQKAKLIQTISAIQWIGIGLSCMVALFILFTLARYWYADTKYAYGYNLNRAGEYQAAAPFLTDAVNIRSNEPVFQDELSLNNAILSIVYLNAKEATPAAQLAKQSLELSNNLVENHPNNILFWKTRTRIFAALAQIEPSYITVALDSIQRAAELAPTDAKVQFNLGMIHEYMSEYQKAADAFEKTIQLKPDYAEAYYHRGLVYRALAIDKEDRIVKPELQEKASASLHYILDNIASQDAEVKKTLKEWGENIK